MAPAPDHRRPDDTVETSQPSKKIKVDHKIDESAARNAFVPGIFDPSSVAKRRQEYVQSAPYLHSVFNALIAPDLLQSVQNELLNEITFTEKETDIYKVHQTGDLASLSYLSEAELSRLSSVWRLRNALYSSEFRQLMRDVTGCGPLSGAKQDMSVNSYRKGCHLLNHDDVIGTRRVSYILYMPIGPGGTRDWKPEWGGALELYPVHAAEGGMQPDSKPSLIIPPSWNQFTFFEVQPGHSFHSVEEVVVGLPEDGVQRLSISGWFHAAQEGEEGYDPAEHAESARQNSSLSQLSAPALSSALTPLPTPPSPVPADTWLSDAELADLTPYLNPVYLQQRTLTALTEKFSDDSSIQLHAFLKEEIATLLANALPAEDDAEGLGTSRSSLIPPHSNGTNSGDWTLKGPPHKSRYCVLSPSPPKSPSSQILHELQTKLFTSKGFLAWVRLLTTLVPLSYHTEARRFRPGLDYTLARSQDDEARLDVVLGLTPEVELPAESPYESFESGNVGGWECYMAPHEGEDDPAVYRSGRANAKMVIDGEEEAFTATAPNEDDANADSESDEDDEDDALLTVQAGFNQLLLVLRDAKVMRFVKYVSASAPGSRWDVSGEYGVGMVQEEDDGEDDDE